jgi:C1q domain
MTISATSQGLKPGVCISTNRPSNPYDGMVIYETDTDLVRVWNGSAWKSIASTNGATFDSTGRMTNPVQPCFFVANENGSSSAQGTKITFNSEVVDIGNCWDTTNHRFTAPITGYYEISFSICVGSGGGAYIEMRKNGVAMSTGTYPRPYSPSQYVNAAASGILSLTANDYLELWMGQGSSHTYHSFASGKLIS